MKLNKILFCAAMTSILPLQHAFSAPVNSVEVQVIDTNGGTSQLLLQKMSSSMQVVADQLFIDKDTAMIEAAGEDYARLLASPFWMGMVHNGLLITDRRQQLPIRPLVEHLIESLFAARGVDNGVVNKTREPKS